MDNSLFRRSPLIGRERECAELHALLTDPTHRLITLVGPGGIGKTRLAVDVMAQATSSFPDGAVTVPLQPVSSEEALVAAIAAALGVQLLSERPPQAQLLDAISGRRLLLLLDNFEQLVEASHLLVALLDAAPQLTLFVTSRAVLNLHEERVYPLEGLDTPADSSATALTQSSAVQLFVQRAQHARHDWALEPEREAVRRICQLTEGLPLAIELAAAWVRTLPCAVIATEISQTRGFLQANLRDLPERHRSVRATFVHSWQLLSDKEQRVFARLSVFRGGFTREAAEQVAQANLPILATLLDKSLIARSDSGRFHLHELLRQYAEEQLSAMGELAADTRRAHAAFYLTLLDAQFTAMIEGEQHDASQAIAAELPNVRAAWPHAFAVAQGEALRRAAHALRLYYIYCGPYSEGRQLLEGLARQLRAEAATPNDRAVLADILVGTGWLAAPSGQFAAAEAAFAESQALYAALQLAPPLGIKTDPQIGQAFLALQRGDYGQAARLSERARQRAEAQSHPQNLACAWYTYTLVAFEQGQYQLARSAADTALRAAHQMRDPLLLGLCLCNLGEVSAAQGAYAEARHYFQASYDLCKAFNDPQSIRALMLLAGMLQAEGELDEAQAAYERCAALYQENGDLVHRSWALGCLGAIAYARGHGEVARQHYREALRLARALPALPTLSALLVGVAELWQQTERAALGVELLVGVLRHPANDRATGDRAQQLLLRAEERLDPALFAAAVERGQAATLAELALRALPALDEAELPVMGAAGPAQVARPVVPAAQAASPFFDLDARELLVRGERVPLSPLEFNVLRYLSERAGKAVPRGDLLEDVWGTTYDGGSNVVDAVVRSLRKKLGPHASQIETVTKVGYRYRRS